MRKTGASLLAVVAVLLVAAVRGLLPGAPNPPARPPAPAPTLEARRAQPPQAPDEAGEEAATQKGASSVDDLDPRLRSQIVTVIESVERTGRPPEGVAQGGRRGKARGVFENAEGHLPAQPPGYYVETDVWPKGPAGRGAERLIFGRRGEVYYSPNHYRSFIRVK